MPKKVNKNRDKWRRRKSLPRFEAGDLVLRGVSPYDALSHKEMCQASAGYLGSYLGWAINSHNWSMKEHLTWLIRHAKVPQPYESYGAFIDNRMVGFFSYSAAKDFLGTQICYLVDQRCAGMGIATEVLETLVQKAFTLKGFEYVELHIDVDNLASKKVATKVGFSPAVSYSCAGGGSQGSGHMQVWVKLNPRGTSGITLESFQDEVGAYLAPAYHNMAMAMHAIEQIKSLSVQLQTYLSATGFTPSNEIRL